MNLEKKKVLVVGSGISGIGAVKMLIKQGAYPVLFDENEKITKEDIEAKLEGEKITEVYVHTLPQEVKDSISLVVLSPGVPVDTALCDEFRKKGISIWGEIELGFQAEKGKVIAITGTNGKTTTTTLVGEIMKSRNEEVFVVGNIGNPYTLESDKTSETSVTVGELSSFQLETVENFRPMVSAILNVTPDHLNRHHTMENYAKAKEAIAMNQTKEDTCVLNYDNEYTRAFGERCPAKVVYFSSCHKLKDGIYLDGEEICIAENGKETRVMNIHDMNLVGICNVENVMAAIGICLNAGVPLSSILNVVRTFKAVEHRIEFVATKRGVDYYNDSKGTNPDAAIQGIKAMSKKTVLIGGGYDKQNEYDEWIESFDGKVKKLVLIGQTREKIAECAKKHGFTDYCFADTFEEAMQICTDTAKPGEAVLLSPACASWGMFPNYEVRGKIFKDYVNNIEE
ncbi:MAG: UDP-N-acetylmuramoyl-L-alanine--D-glutamate ligase [Lachnospiraceae bacterium]|nr:UDP-N-acetylmuramoyl-L-alanine--D-glutamate ligase [Lachnospiraceae bacterium]